MAAASRFVEISKEFLDIILDNSIESSRASFQQKESMSSILS